MGILSYEHRQIPDKNAAIVWAQQLVESIRSQTEVSEKFDRQLQALITETGEQGFARLHERIVAAAAYFSKSLEALLDAVIQHANEMKVKKKVKKYLKELRNLEIDISRKKQQIAQAVQLSEGLMKGTQLSDLLQLAGAQKDSCSRGTKRHSVITAKPKGRYQLLRRACSGRKKHNRNCSAQG